MSHLYGIARPFLLRMDPEAAHGLALKALKSGLVRVQLSAPDPMLEVRLFNRKFSNPIGLAAGFDKNAAVTGPLFSLGFGFVEAGTVTPRAQEGNPRPRIFRDARSGNVINAMGFPNEGLEVFTENLRRFFENKPATPFVLGLNIGMNKGQSEPAKDYTHLIRHLGPFADYLTVNISSPNTPGLRDLQTPDNLRPFLMTLMEERAKSCGATPPALLVKLSPDIERAQEEQIARILTDCGIDGIILTNTTLDRGENLPLDFTLRRGGLSGPALKNRATAAIKRFYALTDGNLPIIGAGGIATAEDAYEKIRAGATLLQLYTALTMQGPGIISEINHGLAALLRRDGYRHITDAVGADHRAATEQLRTGT